MVLILLSLVASLVSAVTRPWRQLFWLALHLYVSVCSVLLNQISGAYLRCFQVVTAYRREQEVLVRLDMVRRENEDLAVRNHELQRESDALRRDRRRILEALDLAAGERKNAMATVRFLERKVQDLELVNQHLAESEEVQRRDLVNTVAALTPFTKPSLDHKTLDEMLLKDSYPEPDETRSLTAGAKHLNLAVPFPVEADQGTAFTSSVFSALLSTLVAMIAWEAKDPCKPLMAALFIVVGMSLANVVRFFNRVRSAQGFLAIALLSLNWFMLGTLAHPALPYLGQMWTGGLWFFGHRFILVFGFGRGKGPGHDEF